MFLIQRLFWQRCSISLLLFPFPPFYWQDILLLPIRSVGGTFVIFSSFLVIGHESIVAFVRFDVRSTLVWISRSNAPERSNKHGIYLWIDGGNARRDSERRERKCRNRKTVHTRTSIVGKSHWNSILQLRRKLKYNNRKIV